MPSAPTATPTRPEPPLNAFDPSEFRRGWRIVLGSTIGLGTGASLLSFVASLLIIPLTTEFGWSRGDMSIAGAVAFLGVTLAIPVIGWLIDRFGYRRVALVSGCVLGLLYLAAANQPGSFAVYLALMALFGMFGAGTSSLVYTRPVIGAFDRHRGLALGLATAGTSVSIFLAPPIMQWIITDFGWRMGFYGLGIITTLIGLPLALYLIGKPASVATVSAADVAAADIPALPRATGLDLREAARTWRFWLLVTALVCINIPGAGVVGQLAPLITDTGLTGGDVAMVMSFYAVGLLSGRVGCGFCLDRFPAPMAAAVFTFIPTFGCLILLLPEPSFALAALAVMLIGLQQGSETDLLAYFVSRGFGIRRYGSIYGAIATFGALSTLTGLLLFGQIHDATGSYNIALLIGAAAFVLGAISFFAIIRTKAVWT